MENSSTGVIADTRGTRSRLELATVKPWTHARPAVLAGLPVITAPDARIFGAEVCPSPDRIQVTPSNPAMTAFPVASTQALGASAQGYVPTSKGSIRPAPPG